MPTTRRAVRMKRKLPKGSRLQVYGFSMVEFGALFGMTPESAHRASKARMRRGKMVPPRFDPEDLDSIIAFALYRRRLKERRR